MARHIPFALANVVMQPLRCKSPRHFARVLHQVWHEVRPEYETAGALPRSPAPHSPVKWAVGSRPRLLGLPL